MLIDQEAVVKVDDEGIEILRALGQIGGYEETLGTFRDRPLGLLPKFFKTDSSLVAKMKAALDLNYAMTPAS